jgi:DNA sulfur modification protein DndD
MIRFKKLRLKNFTRIRNAEIEFSQNESKPLTLIYGVNGSGKTTIMRAIRWALHGDTNDRNFNNYSDLLNRNAQLEGIFNYSVTIIVKDNDFLYEITRSCDLKKGIIKPSDDSDFDTYLSVTRDGTSISDSKTQVILENLFPKDLLDFYFFDGEDLTNYESHVNNDNDFIKNKIEKVTKIPELIRLERILSDTKKILDEKSSKNSGENSLNTKINDLSKIIKDNDDIIELEDDNIKKFEAIINGFQGQITDGDEDTLNNLEGVEKTINDLTSDYSRVETLLLEASSDLWIHPIKKKLEVYSEKTSGISSYVEHGQLNELLEFSKNSDNCPLCNITQTDISKGFIEQSISEAKERDDIFNIRYIKILEKINEDQSYNSLYQERIDLRGKLALAKTEKESYKSLSKEKRSSVKTLLDDIKNYQKYKQESQKKYDAAFSLLKDDRPSLELYQKLRAKELEDNKSKDLVEKQALLAFKASIFITEFKSNLIKKTKNQVEIKANKIFQNIETEKFTLRINDQYALKMYSENNIETDFDSVEWKQSGAQSVFVALSLITALKETASISGPMIIDTLFLRVDKKNIIRIIDKIQDLAPQLTLIDTDTVYEVEDIKNKIMEKSYNVYEAVRIGVGNSELQIRD